MRTGGIGVGGGERCRQATGPGEIGAMLPEVAGLVKEPMRLAGARDEPVPTGRERAAGGGSAAPAAYLNIRLQRTRSAGR
jgi:hypothetical protein